MNAIERNWGVLESFVGRDLEIKSVNRGDDKWYAAIYREYKQSLLDDCSINKKVKSGKFYKKFYAD
jgi:hypothetical protein